MPDEAVREAIRRGICKVNYATELRIAYSDGVKEVLNKNPETIDPDGNADSSACICAASDCRPAAKKRRAHFQCTDFPVLQCEYPNPAAAF